MAKAQHEYLVGFTGNHLLAYGLSGDDRAAKMTLFQAKRKVRLLQASGLPAAIFKLVPVDEGE